MGNVKGIQDLNATWEAGFTKFEHGYEIGKENMNIRDSDDRSSRKKEAGMRAGSGPPVSRHLLY